MPAAVVKGFRSRWMLALATCLTYLLIPVGCVAGFHLADVTSANADRSPQVAIDDAHPLEHSIAVVLARVDVPTSAEATYWVGRDPERYLADFRLTHPGYSFVPPSDHGHISGGEAYVDYQVVKRDSGKAVVKTHLNAHELGVSTDVRATYEATESDIRLISYRSGSDNATGMLVGALLAVSLALLGRGFRGRLATSAPLPERVAVQVGRWRRVAGAVAMIALVLVLPTIAAGWWPLVVVSLALFVLAALAWDFLRLLESKAAAPKQGQLRV